MDAKNSLKTLKSVLELATRYQLDSLEFNGIKFTKSRHVLDTPKTIKLEQEAPQLPSYEPTTVEELDAEIKRMIHFNG